MSKPTTFERDRKIFSAFEAGRTLEHLAEDYHLTLNRIRAVIISERHKRSVSIEPFYRNLRESRMAGRSVKQDIGLTSGEIFQN